MDKELYIEILSEQSMNNSNQKNNNNQMQLTQKEIDAKNSEAYYQATMDWQRGGKNPDEAYKDRGFKKNNRGHWVFK